MSMIKVYSKPGCTQCVATVARLKARGFEKDKDFVYLDVTVDEKAESEARSLGIRSMPIVVVGDSDNDKWGGFNPDRIDAIPQRLTA